MKHERLKWIGSVGMALAVVFLLVVVIWTMMEAVV